MTDIQLRPAQQAILEYTNGRMAVSAVPGSGKTFTLSLLAAQLIADGRLNPDTGQRILIVTYLNASVDNFKNNIRKRLDEMGIFPVGFDVRTLHSLALEIVNVSQRGLGDGENAFIVLDEGQSTHFLARAVDAWIENNPDLWHAFLPDDSPQMKARWRSITESTAKTFIRAAKNERYQPEVIMERLRDWGLETGSLQSPVSQSPLLQMLTGIYGRYQSILHRQAAYDFDDLIWQAVDLLEQRPSLAEELRQRWPYVLEDEAQDSVPLQEILLSALTGPNGNLVRVGDPNQAITSTFTAAHPRFFNAFIEQEGVVERPLPNSGRCAPLILNAANHVLHWVIDNHPVLEVRENTFRRQDILPTPPGDAQPNPPDSEAKIEIRVFKHREDEELPAIAKAAIRYAKDNPQHTLAILVPTNQMGHAVAEHLDEIGADYDNLLRGGSQEREIAAAMHAILALLADPLDTRALVNAHASLHALGHPAAPGPSENLERFHTILRSTHRPEALLFPWQEDDVETGLPAGIATEDDLRHVERLVTFLRRMFDLRPLPIDDLALALGDELFAWGDEVHEADLALAYQIATTLRGWRDAQPELRLPELVAELEGIATGRRRLPVVSPTDYGYEPKPGRLTLTTQHSAKGLEWDAVYLVGIDGFWIPGNLDAAFLGVHDFLGGDPTAEATAQLNYLMKGEAGIFEGRTATESAHIEIISERLRLLYVGITRARRYLHLSRSRATRQYNREREAEPATVIGVLYRYLKSKTG
ncbi:MAG: ATP-dependent helicase [Ardenticatenaceae bacterium]|nr:ATP-dependent helicase [Ardenticatenaceae bacterium]